MRVQVVDGWVGEKEKEKRGAAVEEAKEWIGMAAEISCCRGAHTGIARRRRRPAVCRSSPVADDEDDPQRDDLPFMHGYATHVLLLWSVRAAAFIDYHDCSLQASCHCARTRTHTPAQADPVDNFILLRRTLVGGDPARRTLARHFLKTRPAGRTHAAHLS